MPLTTVIVGAGQRGRDIYGAWALAHPDLLSVVAVCDSNPERARSMAERHGVGRSSVFTSTAALFGLGRVADACIIASPDRLHHEHATHALEAGYDVLVEKPMAATLEDSIDLVRSSGRSTGSLHVGHVLRHTAFFQRLHELVGEIGDIVTVEHRENVVAWHMAHSFVRGNWSNAETSTPMIVAKCCHDFDILAWNLDSPVTRIASFGSLFEFQPHRAPANSTGRCLDCPVEDCPYDGRRVYLDQRTTGWPVSVMTEDLSPAGREHALRTGPYGRCAFQAGSTVVDHQVVAMQTESGASATLTMHGHSPHEHRSLRYDGTRATIRGVFGRRQHLEIGRHRDGSFREVPVAAQDGGHGGGDDGIMRAFVDSLSSGTPGPTDAWDALESHLLAFSAEHARVTQEIVNMYEIRKMAR